MIDLPRAHSKHMKQLTPYRRELMLKVMDGDQRLGRVLFYWNSKESSEVEMVLRFLIEKQATGKTLGDWIFHTYGKNSEAFEGAYQWCVSKLDKVLRPKPIIIR